MARKYQKKIPVTLDCGLHLFLEVMSGKWKITLIWSIYNGIKRPGEIHRTISGASRRVLDSQLHQLVDHGLISKNDFREKPFKVEYELTALGASLIPVIRSTAAWGEAHRVVLEEKLLPALV